MRRNLLALSNAVKQQLPEIPGLEWRVDIVGKPFGDGLAVYVSAKFDVTLDQSDAGIMEDVLSRVHQMTAMGQVQLKLEKY